MKYYCLEGNMKPDAPQGPEFKELLDAHHGYLAKFSKAGKVLTCGPLVGGRGGIIVIRLDDDESVDEFIAGDPFSQSGIQEYKVTQFNVFFIQEYAKEWTN